MKKLVVVASICLVQWLVLSPNVNADVVLDFESGTIGQTLGTYVESEGAEGSFSVFKAGGAGTGQILSNGGDLEIRNVGINALVLQIDFTKAIQFVSLEAREANNQTNSGYSIENVTTGETIATSLFSGSGDTLLTIDPSSWTQGSYSTSWRIRNIWGSNGRENVVDNVTFNAIPEPASFGILSLSSVFFLRRRRQK